MRYICDEQQGLFLSPHIVKIREPFYTYFSKAIFHKICLSLVSVSVCKYLPGLWVYYLRCEQAYLTGFSSRDAREDHHHILTVKNIQCNWWAQPEFAVQFVVTQPTIEIATFCDLWDDTWQFNCLDWVGWRLGWACAAASIASAIRNIHIKLTDSAPAPFQEAALIALTSTADYYTSLTKVSLKSNHASFRLSYLTLQLWWLWLGLWGEKRLHPSVAERLWLQNQLQATRFSICICWAANVLSTFRCEFLQWEIELHLKHFSLYSGTQWICYGENKNHFVSSNTTLLVTLVLYHIDLITSHYKLTHIAWSSQSSSTITHTH